MTLFEFQQPFLCPGKKLVCFDDSLTDQGIYVDELRKLLPQNTIINAGGGGDKPLPELLITREGIHPTEETYRLLARVMVETWNHSQH